MFGLDWKDGPEHIDCGGKWHFKDNTVQYEDQRGRHTSRRWQCSRCGMYGTVPEELLKALSATEEYI